MSSLVPRAMMGASAVIASLSTCGWFRSIPNTLDPVAPAAAEGGCVPGSWRCEGGVPERCDTDTEADAGTRRWWPTTPRQQDGSYAPCSGVCIVDRVAHCAQENAAR